MNQNRKMWITGFAFFVVCILAAYFAFVGTARAVKEEVKQVVVQATDAGGEAVVEEEIDEIAIFDLDETELGYAEIQLSAEEAAPILAAAADLVRDEISSVGSFEVDDPDTGNLLNLQFSDVDGEVLQVIENEYLLKGNFTGEDNKKYAVGIYVEKLEDGTYEIVDAVVEAVDGKPVFE